MLSAAEQKKAQAWVNRVLTQHWDQVATSFGREAWMPVELPGSRPGRRLLAAYGCGHYGCAMPTQGGGMVCKVSSDASEMQFVQAALQIGDWPDGIVRYHAAMDLADSHLRRPVSVIWREEAFEVGVVDVKHYAYREFSKLHDTYLNAARVVREMATKPNFPKLLAEAKQRYRDWAWQNITVEDGERKLGYGNSSSPRFMNYKGAQRLAAALFICEQCFTLMENTAYAYTVGAALQFYYEHGILLADVHTNNIGKVVREDHGGMIYAITDPGHAVFIGAPAA